MPEHFGAKPSGYLLVHWEELMNFDAPAGYGSVTPYLSVVDAAVVLEFAGAVFDATVTERITDDEGGIRHAEFRIGGSLLMTGSVGDPANARASVLYVYSSDCDEIYRRALAAGGTSVSEPADQVYGDRTAAFKGPAGNQWHVATRKETLTEAEIQARS